MTPEQALQTIEQALNLATQKGAFTLADIQMIIQALQTLTPPPPQAIKDGHDGNG